MLGSPRLSRQFRSGRMREPSPSPTYPIGNRFVRDQPSGIPLVLKHREKKKRRCRPARNVCLLSNRSCVYWTCTNARIFDIRQLPLDIVRFVSREYRYCSRLDFIYRYIYINISVFYIKRKKRKNILIIEWTSQPFVRFIFLRFS